MLESQRVIDLMRVSLYLLLGAGLLAAEGVTSLPTGSEPLLDKPMPAESATEPAGKLTKPSFLGKWKLPNLKKKGPWQKMGKRAYEHTKNKTKEETKAGATTSEDTPKKSKWFTDIGRKVRGAAQAGDKDAKGKLSQANGEGIFRRKSNFFKNFKSKFANMKAKIAEQAEKFADARGEGQGADTEI